MIGLSGQAVVTLAVVAVLLAALVVTSLGADVLTLGALAVLLAAGILTPAQAAAGFASEALLTLAGLYIVAAALTRSGAIALVSSRLLGEPRTDVAAQARVVLPVAALSAFVNNTPLVAVYLPLLQRLARRAGLAPSRLFLPLSYAAILGGLCTLIGTSTNIVVRGLMVAHNAAHPEVPVVPFGMFSTTPVGVPVALAGVAYLLLAGRRLLPGRSAETSRATAARQYTVAMRVAPGCVVSGLTVEAAGLRHLRGLFLAHIERHHAVLPAVGPDSVILDDDVLVFVGALDSVVDLQQVRGLVPVAADDAGNRHAHQMVEAIVAPGSPLVGRTIRDGSVRTRYGGVIMAVHRYGTRLEGKLGDIRLQAGDSLLIEAPEEFVRRHRDSAVFHLLTAHDGTSPPRHDRAWAAVLMLVLFVGTSATGVLDTMTAALLAAVGVLVTRCLDVPSARAAVDWPVLVVLGAGLGIGRAVEQSGLAAALATGMLGPAVSGGLVPLLAAVYALTWLLTSVLSNSAAAVLVFPVAWQAAQAAGVPFEPVVLALTVAASCEFTTPLGYQTNLMVLGPGGYRVADYVRYGGPLTVICGVVTVLVLGLLY